MRYQPLILTLVFNRDRTSSCRCGFLLNCLQSGDKDALTSFGCRLYCSVRRTAAFPAANLALDLLGSCRLAIRPLAIPIRSYKLVFFRDCPTALTTQQILYKAGHTSACIAPERSQINAGSRPVRMHSSSCEMRKCARHGVPLAIRSARK